MTSFNKDNNIGIFQFLSLLWVVLMIMAGTTAHVFAAEEEGYILGGGDTVKISVYEQPDLTTIVRINHLGSVIYPILGELVIGGLTPEAAGRMIAKRLKEEGVVKAPQVTLSVEEYRSHQVSVLGQVDKPGKYTLEGKTTVIDLLAWAGGLTQEAADLITIVRNDPKRPARYQIDLLKFYGGDMGQNIEMIRGDIVLVPKMDIFYVYGEVKQPGVYRLERGMTTMQALSVGGGLTARGSSSGITIGRRLVDGRIQQVEVGLTDTLKPNDVLYVKERLF